MQAPPAASGLTVEAGASALGLGVRAGQLCAALLARHRPLLVVMGTTGGPARIVHPLQQVHSGHPLRL